MHLSLVQRQIQHCRRSVFSLRLQAGRVTRQELQMFFCVRTKLAILGDTSFAAGALSDLCTQGRKRARVSACFQFFDERYVTFLLSLLVLLVRWLTE